MNTISAELILCVIPLLQLNKTTLYGPIPKYLLDKMEVA